MGRLFGTDGARGIANRELSCELVMQIGRAVALLLSTKTQRRPRVLVGMDTRASSDMLEAAICAGLCSMGADVLLLGVLPTPSLAFLVRKYAYDAAIMISASHNSFEYNGIKIFQGDGYKLPDELEEKIEAIILEEAAVLPLKTGEEIGRILTSEMPIFDYIEHICGTLDFRFNNMRIALDCANGSASVTAPELFMRMGAVCSVLHNEPNGLNINADCGSTHMDILKRFVVENGLDAGFAFDGDADRVLAVDEKGNVVDGDQILAICARDLQEQGRLEKNTLVTTVMSNFGLRKFCEEQGIVLENTKVGDRYVLERMREGGFCLGGEQSGHIILSQYASTGDGQLTAAHVLQVMKRSGKPLSELAACMTLYPQVLLNVRVSNFGKVRFDSDAEIAAATARTQAELGENGRVLVRVSGTEPLVRVMLEGQDEKQIRQLGEELAAVVRERLL